jgi:hypothetical protein
LDRDRAALDREAVGFDRFIIRPSDAPLGIVPFLDGAKVVT